MADGKTPLALLSEQLDLLTTQIDRIADRVNGVHSDKLIANGRFLSQKFGPGPLDLDAGRPDTDAGRKGQRTTYDYAQQVFEDGGST